MKEREVAHNIWKVLGILTSKLRLLASSRLRLWYSCELVSACRAFLSWHSAKPLKWHSLNRVSTGERQRVKPYDCSFLKLVSLHWVPGSNEMRPHGLRSSVDLMSFLLAGRAPVQGQTNNSCSSLHTKWALLRARHSKSQPP